MADRIEIRGLRALGVIGVQPEERERPPALRDRPRRRGSTSAKAGHTRRPRRHRRLRRSSTVLAEQVVADRVAPAARAGRAAHRRELLEPRPAHRRRHGHDPQAAPAAPGRRRHDRGHHHAGAARDPSLPRPRLQPRRPGRATSGTPWPRCPTSRQSHRSTRPTRSAARTDQGPYLNMVVRLETDAQRPRAARARAAASRRRPSRERVVHWGPRTLDVDVLWIDGVTVDEPDLTVPHPRLFGAAVRPGPAARTWRRTSCPTAGSGASTTSASGRWASSTSSPPDEA